MRADPAFDRGLAGRHDLRLAEPTAALLRSDDVDRVWYQVRSAQGELVGGDAELAPPPDERAPADEVQFRDDTVHNDAGARRLPVGGHAGGRQLAASWCRWPRPSTSARAWPPRSSRA